MVTKKTMKRIIRSRDNRVQLAQERTELSEERTLLSYVRTALAVIGVGLVLSKLYIGNWRWITLITIVLFLISIIIIYEEIVKLHKLRFLRLAKKRKN